MNMQAIIRGKVAKILSGRELVINRGSKQGVTAGMKFQIIEPEIPIQDPDSKKSLGVIQREKIKVKVVDVFDEFCIAQTYETYDVIESDFFDITRMFTSRTIKRVRMLRSKDAEATKQPITDTGGAFVEVGDLAVQIAEQVALA